MIRRALAWLLWLTAGAVLCVVLLAAVLVATEAGARWATSIAVGQSGGRLEVGRVEGRLIDGLRLADVRFSDGGRALTVRHFALAWQARALLRRTVHIERIELEGVAFNDTDQAEAAPAADAPLPAIELPVSIQVDLAELVDFTYARGETTARLDSVRLSAGLDHGGLRVDVLEVRGPAWQVSLSGDVAPAPPYPFAVEFAWEARLADQPPVGGNGALRGDIEALEIQHALDRPATLTTEGTVALKGGVSVELEGRWSGLAWPPAGEPAFASPAGRYRVSGRPQDFTLTLESELAVPGVPVQRAHVAAAGAVGIEAPFPFDVKLEWGAHVGEPALDVSGRGHFVGTQDRLHLEHRLEAPAAVVTAGEVSLQGGIVGLDLSGKWEAVAWPLTGAPEYRSAGGTYSLRGTLEAFRLQVAGDVSGPQIPAARVTLAGNGTAGGLQDLELGVEALGGTLSASGEVAWQPEPAWRLALAGGGIDPGLQWADWPGKLGLSARSSGRLVDGKVDAEARIERLDGTLRGYPLAASGEVEVRGTRLVARGLSLRSGDNHLALDGSVAEAIDIGYVLDARDLGALWPGLEGRATGEGRLQGSAAEPAVQAKIEASGIGYEGNRVGALRIEARIDPRSADTSDFSARATALSFGGRAVEGVTVDGQGNLSRHRLDLAARAEGVQADLTLSGGYRDQQWAGKLESGAVNVTPVGVWRLREPVRITAGPEQFQASTACLGREQASACTTARWQRDSGAQVQGRLAAVPLAFAGPFLPPALSLEGALEGTFSLSGQGASTQARAHFEVPEGKLRFAPPDEAPVELALRDVLADARYAKDAGVVELALGFADAGRARGALRFGPATPARTLDGRLQAELPDLSPFAALVPRIRRPQGALTLDATVAGTSSAPQVRGIAELKEFSAIVPELGLELAEGRVAVEPLGTDRLQITGSLRSGEGSLQLDGNVALDAAAGWPLAVRLTGEDFQVARLEQVRAAVSPALDVEMNRGQVSVRGKIKVPSAQIELKELPQGAVSVSEDEVIVGAQAPKAQAQAAPTRIKAQVEVELGDAVSFSGVGLSTGLKGKLALASEPGQAPRAQGALSLDGGRYKAYGQNLDIERGRLLFAGPVDNPNLDVRAVRRAGSVTAGLQVEGPLKRPRTRIFSEPAMAEAEALSYLLTGGPLSGGTAADQAALTQAALSLGLEQTTSITQQLGQSLGLNELSVSSGGGLEQSALLLGKYLAPDLYVRYALGLFGQPGSLQLQYRINDRLSIEATSGTSQAVDLLYQFERD